MMSWSIAFIAKQNQAVVFGNPPLEVLDSLRGIPNLHYVESGETWTTNEETDD